MVIRRTTRRQFMAATGAASTALLAAPFIRGAYAAGKLSVGFWDHWVPGANAVLTQLVNEWAAQEKVEVQMDFITSQGNKLLLTVNAEAQARTGHDIMSFGTWWPSQHAKNLEPVDELMATLVKQNGPVNPTVDYLGRPEGRWVAVP